MGISGPTASCSISLSVSDHSSVSGCKIPLCPIGSRITNVKLVSSPDNEESNKLSNEFLRENYQIIKNKEDLQKWYNKAEEIGYVAFDTETNSFQGLNI